MTSKTPQFSASSDDASPGQKRARERTSNWRKQKGTEESIAENQPLSLGDLPNDDEAERYAQGEQQEGQAQDGENRQKRSLQNLDERAFGRGERELSDLMVRALDAQREVVDDDLTHGLHAWPARMHHQISRTLLAGMDLAGKVVLDPFAGSGTVLVESLVKGVPSIGVDLNPLAQRVARAKCRVANDDEAEAFIKTVSRVTERSKDRVRNKVDIRAPLNEEETENYMPHVLKELAGLFVEIEAEKDKQQKRLLKTLFSSLVVKFSRMRSDTDMRFVDKNIGRFIPSEFFEQKGKEWAQAWHALDDKAQKPFVHPLILEGSATELTEVLGKKKSHPHLAKQKPNIVITSPPYAGTYDYVDHHLRRTAWLGLDMNEFGSDEIGARRNLSWTEDQEDAKQKKLRWDTEVKAYLQAIFDVCDDDVVVFLLVGDGRIGRTLIPADKHLDRVAPEVGFKLAAVASARRPDFTGKFGRFEHLIALRKA
ncbi:MAG: hypothetical protein GY822_25720 [Deltaproteobacteria bacterium]|nr:hypothetical protein [Deltaproteobacteria bacterium]